MAHACCVLDKQGIALLIHHAHTHMPTPTRPGTHIHARTHTHTPITNTYYFSTAQMFRERASVSRYTHTVCLVTAIQTSHIHPSQMLFEPERNENSGFVSLCVLRQKYRTPYQVNDSACVYFVQLISYHSRFPWPSGLRRESTADSLLRLRVRIPPEACLSLSFECVCCQADYSPRGVLPFVVCDVETLVLRRPWPALGCCTKEEDFVSEHSIVLMGIFPPNSYYNRIETTVNKIVCFLITTLR